MGPLFLLSIFIGINIGCEKGTGSENTSSYHNQQAAQGDEPWKKIDDARLPKHSKNYTDVFQLTYPKDADITFSEFKDWVIIDDVDANGPTKITQREREQISTAKTFDCTPYVWDDALKSALQSAKGLKWLRVSRNATASDLEWIGQMRNLRGLAFNGSDLRKADLNLLGPLSRLRRLSFSGSQMPLVTMSRLPVLPNLEALSLSDPFDSVTIADEHIPYDVTFPKLKILTCPRTDIDDCQFQSFVRRHKNLTVLIINGASQLTARSAVEIGKLHELKYLHIGGTFIESTLYDVDYGGVPYLQSKLPDCFIGVGD